MTMTVSAHAGHIWTIEDLADTPDDGNRYEILDGELLVTPAPSWDHQEAVALLYLRFAAYLAVHAVAHVKLSPADVVFARDTVVEPDLFLVPLASGRKPRTWEEAGRLLLAVEVLSPSSARADRVSKRKRYQREGVPEYWIVDVDARVVERWRPGDERPEILTDRLIWQADEVHPALAIDLPAYFADVLGA